MAIAYPSGTTAKLVNTKSLGTKMRQLDKTQWVEIKTTRLGNTKADGECQQVKIRTEQTLK